MYTIARDVDTAEVTNHPVRDGMVAEVSDEPARE